MLSLLRAPLVACNVVQTATHTRTHPRTHSRTIHWCLQADNTFMYIYGGYDPPSTQFSEMWRFHIMRETWERVEMRGHV
jgi:hypothetical protein